MTLVSYCKRGSNCGNPYMNGKFYWDYIGWADPDCPRCGGGGTSDPGLTDTALTQAALRLPRSKNTSADGRDR